MAMSSDKLIANEFLAFVQHAIDTMDEVSIMQICKSSFSQDEICSGKMLLFQTLGKTAQMPSRRRDGGERSVQDVITLLKVTDPDDLPAFVAKELHKLPFVNFEHVDISRLLKDITFLKTSLAEVQCRLDESETTISELRTELLTLKNNDSVSTSPETELSTSTHVVERKMHPSAVLRRRWLLLRAMRRAPPPLPCLSWADVERASCDTEPTACLRRRAAAVPSSQRLSEAKERRVITCRAAPRDPPKDQCDEDGFTKVERRKKPSSRNKCGTAPTGPKHLLRPAVPTTLLYVSRLHHSTKEEDVVEFLRVKTSLTLRVERLQSRNRGPFKTTVLRSAKCQKLSAPYEKEPAIILNCAVYNNTKGDNLLSGNVTIVRVDPNRKISTKGYILEDNKWKLISAINGKGCRGFLSKFFHVALQLRGQDTCSVKGTFHFQNIDFNKLQHKWRKEAEYGQYMFRIDIISPFGTSVCWEFKAKTEPK